MIIKGKIGNKKYRILKYVPIRNIVSNDLTIQYVLICIIICKTRYIINNSIWNI